MTTTRELVVKDFAFDTDVAKMKKAVLLSIKSLSSSLAIVTSKDPLKLGFLNQIKEMLQKVKLDNVYDVIKNSSCVVRIIEVGRSYIKDFVVARAIDKAEKDELLLEEYEKRSQENLESYEEAFNQKILLLPQHLRPVHYEPSKGMVPDPIKIYEDFEKLTFSKE